jgi:hypothetical protein
VAFIINGWYHNKEVTTKEFENQKLVWIWILEKHEEMYLLKVKKNRKTRSSLNPKFLEAWGNCHIFFHTSVLSDEHCLEEMLKTHFLKRVRSYHTLTQN